MSTRPNIIFIVLDTARARSLSAYSAKGAKSSFISEFSKKNIHYEEAISPAPWTLPAHVSMFTGLTPSEHQINSWEDRLSEDSTTLASILSNGGYQTTGFSHNMWISETFGLTNGFEDFNEQWELLRSDSNLFKTAHHTRGLSTIQQIKKISKDILSNNPFINIVNAAYGKILHNRYDDGARQTNKNIKKWLKNDWDKSRPFFLFANYLEPHIEYDPPEEFAKRYCDGFSVGDAKKVPQRPISHILGDDSLSDVEFEMLSALYKGEIEYLDSQLEELYSILSEEGALENSLVVLVGDHGENIGENGLMSHMYSLHDNLIRVPCMVKTPDNQSANISQQIQTHDLFSLCLHYSKLNHESDSVDSQLPPPLGPGREFTFSELLAENPPEEAVERETNGEYSKHKFDQLRKSRRIIRGDGLKVEKVVAGDTTLYNIDGFSEKVSPQGSSERLEQKLDEYIDTKEMKVTSEETELGQNIENKLEDLGYL